MHDTSYDTPIVTSLRRLKEAKALVPNGGKNLYEGLAWNSLPRWHAGSSISNCFHVLGCPGRQPRTMLSL
jgi:hypothetical protein